MKKYGGNAPRYTSFPMAPHFSASVNEGVYRTWLAGLCADGPASLYLHDPFCHQLCWYCGCNARATQSYRPVAQYLETLIKEFAFVKDAMVERPIIKTVHWGGGTPTILTGGDFLEAMNKLRGSFDLASDAQIAVEIDPSSMTESKAELLACAGVTRASLGVQEFVEHVQSAINRRQSHRIPSLCAFRLRGFRQLPQDR